MEPAREQVAAVRNSNFRYGLALLWQGFRHPHLLRSRYEQHHGAE